MITYVARSSDAQEGWSHKLGIVSCAPAAYVLIKLPAENTIIELSEIDEYVAKELNIRQYKPQFVVVDIKFVHRALIDRDREQTKPYIATADIYVIVCHKHDKVVRHNKITAENTL